MFVVVVVVVFGFRSSLFTNINFFSSAWGVTWGVVRTAVVFFAGFAVDSDFFFYEMLRSLRRGREMKMVGVGMRRMNLVFLTFPSDALVSVMWKANNPLDVSLGSCRFYSDVASIRRREDAEGDRYSCVKVQVDDLSMREHFSNTFQRAERISQEGSLLLGLKKEEVRKRSDMRFLSQLSKKCRSYCGKIEQSGNWSKQQVAKKLQIAIDWVLRIDDEVVKKLIGKGGFWRCCCRREIWRMAGVGWR
jgi:hypothetical protein